MKDDKKNTSHDVTKQLVGEEIRVNPDTRAKAPRSFGLNAEPIAIGVKVQAISTHAETGAPDGGKCVDSRPAEGGRALSTLAADGSYRAHLSGRLHTGKSAEAH